MLIHLPMKNYSLNGCMNMNFKQKKNVLNAKKIVKVVINRKKMKKLFVHNVLNNIRLILVVKDVFNVVNFYQIVKISTKFAIH